MFKTNIYLEKIKIRRWLKLALIGVHLIFFLAFSRVYADKVLFINTSNEQSIFTEQLELISRFYGFDIEILPKKVINNAIRISEFLEKKYIQAIVISANSLSSIDKQMFFTIIKKHSNVHLPILITDVTPNVQISALRNWSEGAIRSCIKSSNVRSQRFCKVTNLKSIAHEFASQKIPLSDKQGIYYFDLNKNKRVEPILEVVSKENKSFYPIFIKFKDIKEKKIFFLTKMELSNLNKKEKQQYSNMRITKLIPLLIFFKYAFGERCWHSSVDYANLTIDDPWLVEPYGNVSYKALFKEMEKINFHTTAAFIPWNYDRSKPEVVELFRNYPNRFSICIHGNNHDHYEFYKYKIEQADPWPAKPLNVQEFNIKQALARMEKFKNLTDLSYDKVMVFPHGIAPAKTLGLLKKYNFLATVNADNVPINSSMPKDILFHLRNFTIRFENFPSIKRYSENRPKYDIALDLFLDNPVLFYVHQDFFHKGINAFNKAAGIVNKIQPNIKWQSLGYIAQHLYLEKLRDDGNYDLLAFTNNFKIENTHQHDLTYFVKKEEDFLTPIKQVTIDGQTYSYKKSGNNIVLEIFVPSKESRHIIIEYENDLYIPAIDISKNNPRINRLRKISDFRDMTLSRSAIGRAITNIYYDTGIYKLGLFRLAILFFLLINLVCFLTFVIIFFIKRRKRYINSDK